MGKLRAKQSAVVPKFSKRSRQVGRPLCKRYGGDNDCLADCRGALKINTLNPNTTLRGPLDNVKRWKEPLSAPSHSFRVPRVSGTEGISGADRV